MLNLVSYCRGRKPALRNNKPFDHSCFIHSFFSAKKRISTKHVFHCFFEDYKRSPIPPLRNVIFLHISQASLSSKNNISRDGNPSKITTDLLGHNPPPQRTRRYFYPMYCTLHSSHRSHAFYIIHLPILRLIDQFRFASNGCNLKCRNEDKGGVVPR